MLDAEIDRLIEGRSSAGVQIAQRQLPLARRLRPFYAVADGAKQPWLFEQWFAREKPDLLLTLYHAVGAWVEGLGLTVPWMDGNTVRPVPHRRAGQQSSHARSASARVP